MSIESFIKEYPANNEFAQNLSIDFNLGESSPVYSIAEIYIDEGSSGLWNSINEYDNAKSHGDDVKEKMVLDEIYLNFHAVLLGVSIKSIENILKNGEFDQILFNGMLASGFTNTGINPLPIPEAKVEKLNFFKLEEMKKVAENDSTYGDFFDTEFESLPRKLKTYLLDNNFKQYSERLLPDYITRTSLLISYQNNFRY